MLFPIAPDDTLPHSKTDYEERKPEPEKLLPPSHDEARTLCNLAAEIKALSPWQWMEETDVFGVEDPDTGEIGFVSVMGKIGEYEAVGVYRGAEGLYGLIDFQTDPSPGADRLMEIPQIQLSFSEPKFLEKRDRELLKGVGLKFTGARPQFRSYRPGFLPWFITLKEARLLIHALSQTLEMTKRFAEQPTIFPNEGDGETESFLVRVSHHEETEPSGRSPAFRPPNVSPSSQPSSPPMEPAFKPAFKIVWEDQIKRIARPKVRPIEISLDAGLLRDLQSIPPSSMQLEADLFLGPGAIGKPQERPLALYMLMLADRLSGIIVGFEALTADDSLNTMHASVPETVARLLRQAKVLPKQIIVRSALLLDLLTPLERELKIQLRRANELPAIDEAAGAMAKWMQAGKM